MIILQFAAFVNTFLQNFATHERLLLQKNAHFGSKFSKTPKNVNATTKRGFIFGMKKADRLISLSIVYP
jgi:hypothetical protein